MIWSVRQVAQGATVAELTDSRDATVLDADLRRLRAATEGTHQSPPAAQNDELHNACTKSPLCRLSAALVVTQDDTWRT